MSIIQALQAFMHFYVMKARDLPLTYQRLSLPENDRYALMLANVAVDVLVRDIIELTSQGVNLSVKHNSGSRATMDRHEMYHHDNRLAQLKQWMEGSFPLSKNRHHDGAVAISLLMAAVNDSFADMRRNNGLPNPTGEIKKSQHDLAKIIVETAAPVRALAGQRNAPLHAPFYRDGSALTVFRFALQLMSQYAQVDETRPQAMERWMTGIVHTALRMQEVMFIPWTMPPREAQNGVIGGRARAAVEDGRGRRPKKPHYNSWIMIDRESEHTPIQGVSSSTPTSATVSVEAAHEAVVNRLTQNSLKSSALASWCALDLRLCDLGDKLKSQVPPDEFSPSFLTATKTTKDNAAGRKVCDETYTWVFRHFDIKNRVHHLALIVGIILARLAPRVYYEAAGARFSWGSPIPSDSRSVTEHVRKSRWIENTKRKGNVSRDPYIAMTTVFIIGLWEAGSPLRRHHEDALVKNPQAGIDKYWSTRHSSKGITTFNLVRMGLATAVNTKILKGTFNRDWKWKTESALLDLYERFCRQYTSNGIYGPFDAVSTLIGAEAATWLADVEQGRQLIVRQGLSSSPVVLSTARHHNTMRLNGPPPVARPRRAHHRPIIDLTSSGQDEELVARPAPARRRVVPGVTDAAHVPNPASASGPSARSPVPAENNRFANARMPSWLALNFDAEARELDEDPYDAPRLTQAEKGKGRALNTPPSLSPPPRPLPAVPVVPPAKEKQQHPAAERTGPPRPPAAAAHVHTGKSSLCDEWMMAYNVHSEGHRTTADSPATPGSLSRPYHQPHGQNGALADVLSYTSSTASASTPETQDSDGSHRPHAASTAGSVE